MSEYVGANCQFLQCSHNFCRLQMVHVHTSFTATAPCPKKCSPDQTLFAQATSKLVLYMMTLVTVWFTFFTTLVWPPTDPPSFPRFRNSSYFWFSEQEVKFPAHYSITKTSHMNPHSEIMNIMMIYLSHFLLLYLTPIYNIWQQMTSRTN